MTTMQTLPPLRTGRARRLTGSLTPFEGVELSFVIVEGPRPGPCLVVTAGVHGSEFCSVEAAVRLAQTRPEDISGTLLVLPIVNQQGFYRRSIYLMPQDGKNLNRMFPGDPEGTASQRLAHWLVANIYPHADAYLDLHGGDLDESLAPFTIFPKGCAKSEALAAAFGVPVAVAATRAGSTIMAANALGVPSLLPEVSGNGLWGEETVAQLTRGLHGVMRSIGMLPQEAGSPAPARPEIMTMWVPTAPCSGLWYARAEVSDTVEKGAVIGEIRDVFGEVRETIRSEQDGRILYRLTSLSVNQGEALLGVGSPLAA
jgi:predicted deacylase